MLKYMNRSMRAFSIVELLIAIVVIGILAGIATVAWGGAVRWSEDRARESDTNQWVGAFELYKSRFEIWPVLPDNDLAPKVVCLGVFSANSSGRCGQYTGAGAADFNGLTGTYEASSGTEFNTFKAAVEKVGKFPTNSGKKQGNFAGPLVYLWQSSNMVSGEVTVTGVFINFFQNACPNGFTNVNDGTPQSIYSSNIVRYTPLNSMINTTNLAASPNTRACGIVKTFTYDTTP